MRKGDAGWYVVSVTYKGHTTSRRLEAVYHPQKELEMIVRSLIAVLLVVIVLALVVFFVWYNRIQIRLFLRRHYGKFDEGIGTLYCCQYIYIKAKIPKLY